MAHDRMTNDDLDRNMGRAGQDDDLSGGKDFGRQTPGRNVNDQQTGQKGADQKNNPAGEDDDFDTGGQGRSGGQDRSGGQNR